MNTVPDTWVMVKVETDSGKPYYKVFASWSGGYLTGDSWRMNSGVDSVTEDDDYYYFHGLSGSVYQCHKEAYGIRNPYGAGILAQILERAGDRAEALDDSADFMNIDYGDW